MSGKGKKLLVLSLTALLFVLISISFSAAEEYDAMKGVNNANVIFDMREGNPKSAVMHIKLIHETYRQLADMKRNPMVVVVFMGKAVKLISSNQSEFSAEEQEHLKEIVSTISKMVKDNIEFEVCLAAVNTLGVAPASILDEFTQVPNGWISEIGYQARGYALVPIY